MLEPGDIELFFDQPFTCLGVYEGAQGSAELWSCAPGRYVVRETGPLGFEGFLVGGDASDVRLHLSELVGRDVGPLPTLTEVQEARRGCS